MFRTAELLCYLGAFASLVGVSLGIPPLPEELPIVAAGVLVGHQEGQLQPDPDNPPLDLRWWLMLPVCMLGVVTGDGLLYGIGRIWGVRVLNIPFLKRMLSEKRLAEIEHNFQERGVLILLFARVLPGIRAPIFLTAGIMRLSWKRFLIADAIYAVPGVSLLFFLAYWFTDQFMELFKKAETIRPILVIVAITAVAGYLLYHFLKKPVMTGDPNELPIIGDVAVKLTKSGEHAVPQLPDNRPLADGVPAREQSAGPAVPPRHTPPV